MSRNVCFWHKADLRRVELLKELTQLMDEPDSKGGPVWTWSVLAGFRA
jgi:hypothetical protein